MQTLHKYSRDQLGDSQDSLFLVSSFIQSNSKVLDVGCYQGSLGRHLIEEKSCIVDGVEYDLEAAAVASEFYRKVVTADLNFDDVTELLASDYDYIIFADVLEHLIEPKFALSKLKKLLKNSGKVVISVPNIGYQGVLAGLADGEFTYRDTGILDRTHLRFFTRKSLKELVRSCDLFPNEIKSVILSSADSEFSEHFCSEVALKQNTFLSIFPDSSVYQFVALCGLSDVMESTPEEQLIEKNQQFKSKLYWKEIGEEYSDIKHIPQYTEYSDDEQTIVFEFDGTNKFDQLRFDPCEESMFCYINSIVVKSQTDEILFIQNMSDVETCNDETKKITFVNGAVVIFSEGSDPGVLIDVSNKDKPLIDKKIKVIIEIGKINSYSDIGNLMNDIHQSYNQVLTSGSWKLTQPLRDTIRLVSQTKTKLNNFSKNVDDFSQKIKKINYRQAFKILIKTWKEYGVVYTFNKIIALNRNKPSYNELEKYELYLDKEDTMFVEEITDIVSFLKHKEKPQISILLPVYNTDKIFLTECIESLITQSYSNWELCICDDASTETHVLEILESFSQKDHRIKYILSETNGHISNATNQALQLATGSHIVLLDHDDLLHKDALLYIAKEIVINPSVDFIYTDEDHVSENSQRKMPFFKPDWSPVLLYSQNYIGHIVCLSKQIIEKVGGFTVGLEGAQDYDLILKATLHIKSAVHIPRVLYHWREHEQSTAMNADSKPYAHDAGKKALTIHLSTKYPKIFSHIEDGDNLFTYKPRFKISSNIKASIIIPIRDKVELLKQLVSSIEEKSTWSNYEIIIIDNGSVLDCTLKYLRELQLDNKFKVINDNSNFNWSKVNNLGATIATGEVFVFLNNDTIVISENWLESLLSWAQLPDVAVVGPQLLYEDDTLQHAGIVVGMGGWADHIFKSEKQMHKVGPFVSPVINRNVLAVTGACQVIERTKFEMLGGFDENFEICGSDVELCIRAHKEGYQNVYLADTVLYHLESKSRSSFVPENDFALSKLKYEPYRKEGVDPFFNPNLDMMSSTPTVKL